MILKFFFDRIVAFFGLLFLWPVILIGLGVELLLSNVWEKKIIYDKGSIVLLFIMTFFAIGMAITEVCMEMAEVYMRSGMY